MRIGKMRRTLAWVAGGLALLALPVRAEEAHFAVRPEVIVPDLPSFTASLIPIGNGNRLTGDGGGFEPSVMRTMFAVTEDAANRIIAAPEAISMFDTLPESTFDGADVEVLRIENGVMQTVRRDTVALFHASGWITILPGNRVVPAGQTRFETSWDGYNRLDRPWYYTVRAVDGSGRLSPPARAAAIQPAAKPGQPPEAALAEMRLSPEASETLAAPTGLTAELTAARTLALSWQPVPDAAGYVVYRSDLPPEQLRGYAIDLKGLGEPLRKGDMAILRKKFYAPRRAEIATNRVWNSFTPVNLFGNSLINGMSGDAGLPNYTLEPHPADTPVADPGETYLHMPLFRGQEIQIGMVNTSGTDQSYYEVLKPGVTYRFEAWMRAKGAASVSFQTGSAGPVNLPGLPRALRVGAEWKKYTIDFTPPEISTSKHPIWMGLRVSGVGSLDLDNFRIYRADVPFMDLLPEERAELAASGMSALRTHSFIKTKVATYDLAQLTDPAGVMPRAGGTSLPQLLGIIHSLDMEPWLQIEPHFSREEWLGLVEYLAAPFDPAKDDPKALPWAAKRVAQGHPAPWTDDFDKIWFEIGNETWNQMFYPWTFREMPDAGAPGQRPYSAGQVYGLFQEHVLQILQESPWWGRISAKVAPVIGGWMINDYGLEALEMSPSSTVLTGAAYIGGWDAGEEVPKQNAEGYASVMAYAPQEMGPRARYFQEQVRKRMPDRKVILGTYESGPGFVLNGLNGQSVTPEQRAEQLRVMTSAAAGAATLDSFLTRAAAGDRLQNFFLYDHGEEWRSHARWYLGGQAFPSWDWLTLFNRIGTGDMLAVDTLSVPKTDVPKMGYRAAGKDLPMAAAYATRRGDKLVVTVVSRLVPGTPQSADGALSVRVDLPLAGAKALTLYRQSGDYTAENSTSQETQMLSEQLPLPANPGVLEIPDMPPASARIYVYEGASFRDPG